MARLDWEFAALGPTLPICAVQQVGGYLGYNGRGANVVAKAALDPLETLAWVKVCDIGAVQAPHDLRGCGLPTVDFATSICASTE